MVIVLEQKKGGGEGGEVIDHTEGVKTLNQLFVDAIGTLEIRNYCFFPPKKQRPENLHCLEFGPVFYKNIKYLSYSLTIFWILF